MTTIDLTRFAEPLPEHLRGRYKDPNDLTRFAEPKPTYTSYAADENDYSHFGVNKDGISVGFSELNKRLDAAGEGPTSQKRYDVQQAWFKHAETLYNNTINDVNTTPKERREAFELRKRILAKMVKPNTIGSQISQAIYKNEDAVAGMFERVGDGIVSHFEISDDELLQNAYPELYEKVQALGGLAKVKQKGAGFKGEDSGNAQYLSSLTSDADLKFARNVVQKVNNLRTQHIMRKANQEAVTVMDRDGNTHKVSRMQADMIKNSEPSRIMGDAETQSYPKPYNSNENMHLVSSITIIAIITIFLVALVLIIRAISKGIDKITKKQLRNKQNEKVDLVIKKVTNFKTVPPEGKAEYIHFCLKEEDAALFYNIQPKYVKNIRPKLENIINQFEQNNISYGRQYAVRQFYIGNKLIFQWQGQQEVFQ